MAASKRRLLVLGGTAEARELAALADERLGDVVEVMTSLAGRTEAPAAVAGHVRRGGFGGSRGLAEFLRSERIDWLIDATHPFATQISAHAVTAAAEAGVRRLVLRRPPWRPQPGDRWIEVGDPRAAASILPSVGRRVWLTVGSDDVSLFAGIAGAWFLVRRVEAPETPLPLADHTLILGRGPFSLVGERELIARYRIDVLVCRASGGSATEAKLQAAREAGLPVVMIRRPPAPPGEVVATASAALEWVVRLLHA